MATIIIKYNHMDQQDKRKIIILDKAPLGWDEPPVWSPKYQSSPKKGFITICENCDKCKEIHKKNNLYCPGGH